MVSVKHLLLFAVTLATASAISPSVHDGGTLTPRFRAAMGIDAGVTGGTWTQWACRRVVHQVLRGYTWGNRIACYLGGSGIKTAVEGGVATVSLEVGKVGIVTVGDATNKAVDEGIAALKEAKGDTSLGADFEIPAAVGTLVKQALKEQANEHGLADATVCTVGDTFFGKMKGGGVCRRILKVLSSMDANAQKAKDAAAALATLVEALPEAAVPTDLATMAKFGKKAAALQPHLKKLLAEKVCEAAFPYDSDPAAIAKKAALDKAKDKAASAKAKVDYDKKVAEECKNTKKE